MDDEQYKTVIVVRKDLNLPIGKWIAQAVHASLRATSLTNINLISDQYHNEPSNQPICIVCYVKKETDFLKLKEKCEKNTVPFGLQVDAGHNFVKSGTITCMSIGPGPKSLVDKITKKLQLLK